MITLGGDAELELVDSLDPFSGAGLPGRTGAGGALRAARALACWLQPCHHAPHPTPCARAEGILFSVRPPKKSWKNIANLSGGEKTLSSLSLVFALHHYKPTPLYVMDEIDAALGALRLGLGGGTVGLPGQHGRGQRGRAVAPLEGANGGPAATHHLAPPHHALAPPADFKNVSIVGHYIKERTKNAQFVIISLRNNMFELADRLVGIYKSVRPHGSMHGEAPWGGAAVRAGVECLALPSLPATPALSPPLAPAPAPGPTTPPRAWPSTPTPSWWASSSSAAAPPRRPPPAATSCSSRSSGRRR